MFDAIAGMFKMVTGAVQAGEGQKKLQGLTRPTYKTPTEINQMKGLARETYADPYMPGEGILQDRLDQGANSAYIQSLLANNPLAAIAAIQSQQQAAQQNLAMQSAQYQRQDLESYYRALQTAAPYTDMEFQMNQFAPYAEGAQEARDMIGAGTKNLYGGMSDLGGIADAWTNQGLQGSGKSKKGNTDSVWDKYNKDANMDENGGYDWGVGDWGDEDYNLTGTGNGN